MGLSTTSNNAALRTAEECLQEIIDQGQSDRTDSLLALVLSDETTFQRLIPDGMRFARILKALAPHYNVIKTILRYVLDRPSEFQRLVTDGIELGAILNALAPHPDLAKTLLLYVLEQPGEFRRLCTGLEDFHCILAGLIPHADLAETLLIYVLRQPDEFQRVCTDLSSPFNYSNILELLMQLDMPSKYKTIFEAENIEEALDRVFIYQDRQEIKKNVAVLNELSAAGLLPVTALFSIASYTANKLSLRKADKIAYAFFKEFNPHWNATSEHAFPSLKITQAKPF